jgi:hypothetical protein
MKKIILNASSILLLMGLLLSSCKKSGDDAPQGSFTWTHKGKSYQATAFAAFPIESYFFVPFNVLAGYGNFETRVEKRIVFHLNSFAVGTSAITTSPPTETAFYYVDEAGNNLDGVSGAINIITNANNRLSGNFSVTLIDASSATSLITGSFTDIPIQP